LAIFAILFLLKIYIYVCERERERERPVLSLFKNLQNDELFCWNETQKINELHLFEVNRFRKVNFDFCFEFHSFCIVKHFSFVKNLVLKGVVHF